MEGECLIEFRQKKFINFVIPIMGRKKNNYGIKVDWPTRKGA